MGSGERPGIGGLLGMSAELVEEGTVSFSVTTRPEFSNPLGMVHGGIAATLLDSVMGCAVHTTLGQGEGYSTVDLHVHYTRPIPLDLGRITATGTVVHRGRRIATAEGRVLDDDGRLLAHATTTCLVMSA
jgi:acyl-CoA thioesterase